MARLGGAAKEHETNNQLVGGGNDARAAFDVLLHERLIPDFCSDPTRRMDTCGFVEKSNRVTEADAADFLRGWRAGLAVHWGRGQYLVGAGRVHEQFFWSGLKGVVPRTFTLFLEPVVTIGAIARLHLDYGWPQALISAQSRDWAFDIVAMADGTIETIAGEVKKTRLEADQLIKLMADFGAAPEVVEPAAGPARNAFKKVASLRKSRASVLWVVGPDRYEVVFSVAYNDDGSVSLEKADERLLAFAP